MTNFVTRSVSAEDIPFLYSTWLKSYRNDSETGLSVRKSIFFESYRLVLDHILQKNTTKVLVACKPDEPNVIYGYMVAEPNDNVLHYVFVKEAFQRFGIANQLFQQIFPNTSSGSVTITHRTDHARDYCKKFIYNPFELYRT
jgi:hypothetical protein